MVEADKEKKAYELLKSLNAAVTTTKLYPSSSRQVIAAEDSAFKHLQEFVEKYGHLSMSVVDDEPFLCGLPVSQKTLGKVPGFEMYQQLRVLGLEHLVLDATCDRALFGQMLTFFITSPQLIRREGDGRSFAVNLGLSNFFPLEHEEDVPKVWSDQFADILQMLYEKRMVRSENILSLVNEIDKTSEAGQKKLGSLHPICAREKDFASLFVAGCAMTLKGPQRLGQIHFPASFSLMMSNFNTIVAKERRAVLVSACARYCGELLNEFSFHILLLQNFTGSFGKDLYGALIQIVGVRLDKVVELMHGEKNFLLQNGDNTSRQYKTVTRGLDFFLETERGHQYLVRTKAKKNLEKGERERQLKRIQLGIAALLEGDVSKLYNAEIVEQLPVTVDSLVTHNKDAIAARIVASIAREIPKAEGLKRASLESCLIAIGDRLVNKEKWEWLERLFMPLMVLVKDAEQANDTLEKAAEILTCLQKHFWKNQNDYDKGDKILMLFWLIRNGKIEKDQDVVALLAKVQDLSVEKSVLADMLDQCLQGKDKGVEQRLIKQGPVAAKFLLYIMFTSNEIDVRLKVLRLLQQMGNCLSPLVVEKLKEPMPWYAKRNLLKILATVGSEKDILVVADYLNHEDERVQDEAFSCIESLSGEDRTTNMLEAFSLAVGPMKERVVRALIPLADEQVVAEILEFVKDWRGITTDIRDSLLVQCFRLLSKSESQEVEDFLTSFTQNEEKREGRDIGHVVWQMAREALRQVRYTRQTGEKIKRAISAKSKQNLASEESLTAALAPEIAGERQSVERVHEKKNLCVTGYSEEIQIRANLQQGNAEQARTMFVELIEKAAQEKNFADAEKLRNWFMEADPSALQDIIRTAEIIEQHKSESITDAYLATWSRLREHVNLEEFNAIYYAMNHRSCEQDDVLVEQGEDKPALVFVNSGTVKAFYQEEDREIFIKSYHPGEIFGMESFFESSFWTFGVSAQSKADVSFLQLADTLAWNEDFPSLGDKLYSFCKSFSPGDADMRAQERSRRKFKRVRIEADIFADLVEKDGRDSGLQMKGDASDVSLGGIAFVVRISQRKNARILLGQSLRMQLPTEAARGNLVRTEGIIKSIRCLYTMTNEYSLHVDFDHPLSNDQLAGIIQHCQVLEK